MSPDTTTPTSSGSVPKVLIVDTDAAPAAYLDERFGPDAFEVEVAADPGVAFEWAQQSRPDLILMSAGLRGTLEAVGSFKDDEELRGVPLVIMAPAPISGRLVRHWFGPARADLYVRTPLRSSHLERFLSYALGAGTARGPADEGSLDTADDERSAGGTWRERAVAAEGSLDQALVRARNAENELGMMRLEIDSLRKKLAIAEEGAASVTGHVPDDTGELEVQAKTLQRMVAGAQRDLERMEARAVAAEEDLHRRLVEVQKLRSENTIVKADNTRLRGKEGTLLADLERMAIAEARLRERIGTYRGQLGHTQGDDSEEFSMDLEDVAVNSEEVDRAAHQRAADAEHALELKLAELQEIQKDIVNVQAENTRLLGQLETLRRDLDLLDDREQNMADERAGERHRLQVMMQTVSEQREELAQRDRQIRQLEDQITKRDSQLKILGKLQG